MQHVLDPVAFHAVLPEFATLADGQLAAYWDMACNTMAAADGVMLSGGSLQLALNLMTAHLARLLMGAGAGKTGGIVTRAGEGSVNVGMAAPPFKDGWQYWLAHPPYGQQLWALLQMQGAGGLYVGGSPERSAFRKTGGVFF